jgi:hypothetical protein
MKLLRRIITWRRRKRGAWRDEMADVQPVDPRTHVLAYGHDYARGVDVESCMAYGCPYQRVLG